MILLQTICQFDKKIFTFNQAAKMSLRTLLGGSSDTIKIRGLIIHENAKSCIEAIVKVSIKK